MRLFDNRYEPHRRKYTLALLMIERGARIRTVTQWTGLSKYCVQNLTRSYGSKTRIPCNRGRSPSKTAYFLKSLDVARESVALAYIALQYQAIPAGVVPDARTSLPGIERGERVMDAFEVYRALVPNARISLEHAILLIIELAERSALMLVRCRSCHDVMVADRLALRQERCPLCRPRPRPRTSLPAHRSERPRDLLRQQEFHEGVEEDNADSTRDGHNENEADREMARGHE
jgi:hypothetical protein